jgi:hypothetical protein
MISSLSRVILNNALFLDRTNKSPVLGFSERVERLERVRRLRDQP